MKDINPDNLARLDYLARQAIDLWGADSQFSMATEETSELLCELTKIHRNRQNWDNILEEACDTYIMMNEIFIIFGPEAVNAMLSKKLDKFAGNVARSIEKRQKKQEELVEMLTQPITTRTGQVIDPFGINDKTDYNGA